MGYHSSTEMQALAQANQAYQEALQIWEATDASMRPPAPQEPPAPFVHQAREAVDNEVIPGEYGEILVIAPKTILTGVNGFEFALDADTLARDYVEVVDA